MTSFPGEKCPGRITAILPSAQAQIRTLTVRAELRNPDLRLRPGMFAQVSLAPTRRETVLIPSEAVIRTGERTLVMLAQQGGGYRSEEHTSELQSLMRISYAVFCLKKKKRKKQNNYNH